MVGDGPLDAIVSPLEANMGHAEVRMGPLEVRVGPRYLYDDTVVAGDQAIYKVLTTSQKHLGNP